MVFFPLFNYFSFLINFLIKVKALTNLSAYFLYSSVGVSAISSSSSGAKTAIEEIS